MNYYRHKNGKFRPHFDWIAIWMFRGMIAIFLYAGAGAVYHRLTIAWQGVVNEQTELYYEAKHLAESVPILPQIAHAEKEDVEALKAEILTDLSENCESKGAKDPNGLVVFDSNREASIGAFQFQRKTVIYYVKKFEGRDIQNSEAVAISIDGEKARELAGHIIFEEKEGWRNWYNCGVKLKFEKRLKELRELQK